ncbi:MAG: rhomboid family intramembrane serine protease [Chlamydiales bacterium]
MRLIGLFAEEKEAHLFCTFLAKKVEIRCYYEAFVDKETNKHAVRVWVEDEDNFEKAKDWYERFKTSPQEFLLQEEAALTAHPITPDLSQDIPEERKKFRLKVAIRPPGKFTFTLTNLMLILCVFLFFWNGTQEVKIAEQQGPLSVEMGFTPLEQLMIFDYPYAYQVLANVLREIPIQDLNDLKDLKSLPPEDLTRIHAAEAIPSWKGAYDLFLSLKAGKENPAPMFEKIRQGEAWRLITPIFMHRGFLHILFNMAWLWILGRQIEERTGWVRMLTLIVLTAIVSNVCQYLMGGPFFLGFSGVVVGMAGFIWMRQKVAPWEGYPLQKTTAFFVLIFVIAMFGLELFSFAMQLFSSTTLSANIANTAHIVGGLVGLALGRLPFFKRQEVG